MSSVSANQKGQRIEIARRCQVVEMLSCVQMMQGHNAIRQVDVNALAQCSVNADRGIVASWLIRIFRYILLD